MDPVVENGIEKFFKREDGYNMNIGKDYKFKNKMVAFQKSNAIFH
jgi:hypothetical protein